MAQASSTCSYKIDKLTGDNYTVWTRRMELLFKRSYDALWKVVNGEPNAGDPGEADWIARDLAGQTEILIDLANLDLCALRGLEEVCSIIIGSMPSMPARWCISLIHTTACPPAFPVLPASVWPVLCIIPLVHNDSALVCPLSIYPLMWGCHGKQPSLSCHVAMVCASFGAVVLICEEFSTLQACFCSCSVGPDHQLGGRPWQPKWAICKGSVCRDL